jgi:hypothetical protein
MTLDDLARALLDLLDFLRNPLLLLGLTLASVLLGLFLVGVRRRRRAGQRGARLARTQPGRAKPRSSPAANVQGRGPRLVDPAGKTLPLPGYPATLGRAPANAVVLRHPTVSKRHAEIYRDAGLGVCIADLGSTNGLLVDGRPTCRNILRDGNTVTLGEVILVFHGR